MPTRFTRCWPRRRRKQRSRRLRHAAPGSDPGVDPAILLAEPRKTTVAREDASRGRIAMSVARLTALALALAFACIIPAHAQYPNRPVTIMVPLAAGSGMDVL